MAVESVIIVGSGPAAYSAALYASAETPLLFEGEGVGGIGPGGQLTITTDVDNYPGFPAGVQGPELMDNMRNHAIERGVRIISANVDRVERGPSGFVITVGKTCYETKTVVVATGASARRLSVPGTRDGEFWQRGISACAVCDGFAFRGRTVAVIGGGDSAMEEILYLSNICAKAILIHRRDGFRAREDKLDKVRTTKNIEIITPAELVSAHGDTALRSLKLVDNNTHKTFDLPVDGLFFGIGHDPNVSFLDGLVELANGYIKTNKDMSTSVPGLFACGDVQDYYYKQAVTAASSGCTAALSCLKYLAESK